MNISEGCYVRLRNGTIDGPVVHSLSTPAAWMIGDRVWRENGRYNAGKDMHEFDIINSFDEKTAGYLKRAQESVDHSFTPDQFAEWLEEVRKAAPGISNKEIAAGIGRTDQWVSNALSRGVNHHSALALWYYLDGLQKNCNT